MRIRVYAPPMCDYSCVDERGFLDLPEGATVRDACAKIKVPFLWRKVFSCAVNHEKAPAHTVLHDGDTLSIFSPITGG